MDERNLILAVRYRDENSHLLQVKALVKEPDSPQRKTEILNRQEVIERIKHGETFMTAYLDEENNLWPGTEIKIMESDGNEYLRTDGSSSEEDNLSNLPTF